MTPRVSKASRSSTATGSALTAPSQSVTLIMALAASIFLATPVVAAVQDLRIADVTTRAFSVIWVSDEPVLADTTVRVFTDVDGVDEITSELDITLVSEAIQGAMENGVVKVDVVGLEPDTIVYVQAVTVGPSGIVDAPAPGELLEVRTAVRTRKADDAGLPIVNDVVFHEVLDPDLVTPGEGSLLVVQVRSLSKYPLTAFVSDGFAPPVAAVDLNNVFDDEAGESAQVEGDTVLEMTEYRGLRCPDLVDHKLLRYRRAPEHEESPAITELEMPSLCFFADTVCDGTVNILDAQRVLNIFNAKAGDCAFNPDLDVVVDDDDVINILDVQRVLNRFGDSAPFGQ